nr:uncharacterized protein LOC117274716 [Nicotiana tomentosiformis]
MAIGEETLGDTSFLATTTSGNVNFATGVTAFSSIDHNHPLFLQPTDTSGGIFKYRKNQVQCEYYHYKGHRKENCYKLHGYPSDFKGKKKGQSFGVYTNNVSSLIFQNAAEAGNQQVSYGTQPGMQQVQHAYMPQFTQTTPNNTPVVPFFTKEQY